MKLNFAALLFCGATVMAWKFPSPTIRFSYGAQRSPSFLTSAAKPTVPIRGNIGNTHHQQYTPTPKLKTPTPKLKTPTGKSSNAKTNKLETQNMVQPTRSPETNPSIGQSRNLKYSSAGKTNNAKSGKMLQQRKTSTLKPPKAEMLDNSPFAEGGEKQLQQDATDNTPTPTSKPSSAEKSSNTNSGKDGQTKLQQHPVTSTVKPPTAEKLANLSSVKDGQSRQNNVHSRTGFYHNYDYRPPQQINYGSGFHPVYLRHPPVYVYEYRDSGSRFDNLLTGLALYNLGRNSQLHHYDSDRHYSSASGEICKLGISKRTGEYEETRIDCNLMSSFIWEDTTSAARNEQRVVKNSTEVTVTRVNGTGNSAVTTVTVTSNTVEDALKVKGPSIAVTPGMTCYMIRTFRNTTALRKPVDCDLLQDYARSSLFPSNAQRLLPFVSTAFNCLIIFFALGKHCE
ncbi:hypothetical protein PYW08_004932 [Mythimna loreyi]|uniref:Uncharacterized protein n=1 Tax=Mythimna loreyi TaxID=667449 RepID=A0ACC2QFL0_9NEOP|nr:hypothetical protein PYW08_004932 [Mythimna loreyi]